MDKKNLLFWIVVSVALTLLLNACATVPVKPCANIRTQQTLWQVGITVGVEGNACNEGISSDLLNPDIYTNIKNN